MCHEQNRISINQKGKKETRTKKQREESLLRTLAAIFAHSVSIVTRLAQTHVLPRVRTARAACVDMATESAIDTQATALLGRLRHVGPRVKIWGGIMEGDVSEYSTQTNTHRHTGIPLATPTVPPSPILFAL